MSKCQKMGSGWLGVPSTLAIFTSPPWLRSLSRASPRHPLKSRPSAPLGKRQLASLVAGDKVRYKCTSSSSFLLNSDGLQPTDDGLHLVAKLLVPILPRRDPGASKPRGLGSNPQSRLTRSFSLSKKRGFERTLHDLCTNPSKFKLGTLLDLCISAPALPLRRSNGSRCRGENIQNPSFEGLLKPLSLVGLRGHKKGVPRPAVGQMRRPTSLSQVADHHLLSPHSRPSDR